MTENTITVRIGGKYATAVPYTNVTLELEATQAMAKNASPEDFAMAAEEIAATLRASINALVPVLMEDAEVMVKTNRGDGGPDGLPPYPADNYDQSPPPGYAEPQPQVMVTPTSQPAKQAGALEWNDTPMYERNPNKEEAKNNLGNGYRYRVVVTSYTYDGQGENYGTLRFWKEGLQYPLAYVDCGRDFNRAMLGSWMSHFQLTPQSDKQTSAITFTTPIILLMEIAVKSSAVYFNVKGVVPATDTQQSSR